MALYRMNLREPAESFPHLILAGVLLGWRGLPGVSLWLWGGAVWFSSGGAASSLIRPSGISFLPVSLLWITPYMAVAASPISIDAPSMSGAAMTKRRIRMTSLCAEVGPVPLM